MFGAAKLSLFLAAPDIGYAYWMGGFASSRVSTTRKYNFFNDVVGSGTAISSNRDQICGLSNTVNGHAFGGSTGSAVTTHDIFNCTSEARSTGTVLTAARRDTTGGTSTSDFGYIFGGFASTFVNTIQKYKHSDDTYPTFNTTVWTGTVWTSVTAHNNSTLACVVGGYNGTNTCNRYKVFTFSTEVISADLTLSPAQGQMSTCGSQAVGYYCSGFSSVSPSVVNTTTVQKFTFSSQTWATGTALGYSIRFGDGASNEVNGVIGGGVAGSFTITTAQTKIAYATDTYSTATQLFTTATDAPGAWSSSQIQ